MLLLIYTCDRQLVAPVRDNPFDSKSELMIGDPFNLQTQNRSDYILINWDYNYENPMIESYLLYRVSGSVIDMLYEGMDTTFVDSEVVWDSTYSYYVTGVINEKETTHPEISDLPKVVRRISVGELDGDFDSITNALDSLNNGDVIYVQAGTYTEKIDFKGKKINLKCDAEPGACILYGDGTGPVVTFQGGEDSTTILDGFKITGGNSTLDGGGMIINSSPYIKNCIFSENNALDRGGAIFIRQRSAPIIQHCTFNNNTTLKDGGAIYCDSDSKPYIDNCEFSGNYSIEGNGGAIAANRSSVFNPEMYRKEIIITSCTFEQNQALGTNGSGGAISIIDLMDVIISLSDFSLNQANKGGALYIFASKGDIILNQCILENNIGILGGGIYLEESGIINSINIQKCLFWNNTAYSGGAIYSLRSSYTINYCTLSTNSATQDFGGGVYNIFSSQANIINSIFWGNIAQNIQEIYSDEFSVISASFSDIKGGFEGEGNIDANPLFINSEEGNFLLQTIELGYNNNSPCKGTGENGTDMGAFSNVIP